ncbi:unnamed protein product [Phytomonas sp. Hart1]|nr:unnamed protein product [Phytomonas sp. Hart1]|eukprot:CCW66717.1 unnamed protein product [Phytomonas sp. isolate Hart1]
MPCIFFKISFSYSLKRIFRTLLSLIACRRRCRTVCTDPTAPVDEFDLLRNPSCTSVGSNATNKDFASPVDRLRGWTIEPSTAITEQEEESELLSSSIHGGLCDLSSLETIVGTLRFMS